MPPDLILANAIILIGSAAIGGGAICSKGILSRWARLALAAFAAASLVVYSLWFEDNPLLARLLPVADTLAWTNIQLPAAALLAGIAWTELRGPRWQRIACCSIVIGLGFWRNFEPYLGTAPQLSAEHWIHGVCHQSTTSTCSPAAAATALAAVGINASEAEMVEICLTRDNGTLMLGLYRGLKLKTIGSKWNVVVFDGAADQLRRTPVPAVAIIHAGGITTGRLSIGDRHAVVIFGFNPDGTIDVGDPYAGRQRWKFNQFAAVYDGEAIALTQRR
jgi:hypothetical protein